jgi:mannosyltransferase OCH1-like enzyme
MIPKIIHYCWFGGNPLPELAQKCIASWEKYFPKYEIKEWNESNYDVHKITYVNEAYYAKKYAFVSDYARFDVLHQYGGVYFDTDVEVIRPFDTILARGGFMGFEAVGKVNTGLGMGCSAKLDIIQQILDFYTNLHFINVDGMYNVHTVVEYVTAVLKKNGLIDENIIQYFNGLTVYPMEYFCPLSLKTGQLTIAKNTYSIHYYDASWQSKNEKKWKILRIKFIKIFGLKIGNSLAFIYFFLLCVKSIDLKLFKTVFKEKISNYIKYIGK